MALKLSKLVKGEVAFQTPNGTERTPFDGWNNLQQGANRSDHPEDWPRREVKMGALSFEEPVHDFPQDGGRGGGGSRVRMSHRH